MIELTLVSQTAKTITLSWQPVEGAAGDVYLANGKRLSNTWDGSTHQATFALAELPVTVESVGVLDSGVYPPPAPPTPPSPPPATSGFAAVYTAPWPGATVDPQSAAKVGAFLAANGNGRGAYCSSESTVCFPKASDPLVTIKSSEAGNTFQVRIPAGSKPGRNPDHHMVVVDTTDPAAPTMTDMFAVQVTNGTYTCENGGTTALDAVQEAGWGATAGVIPIYPAAIKPEDVASRNYHPLNFCSVASAIGPTSVWPSPAGDPGRMGGSGIGFGTRLALPASAPPPAGLSPMDDYVWSCLLENIGGGMTLVDGSTDGIEVCMVETTNQDGDGKSAWAEVGVNLTNVSASSCSFMLSSLFPWSKLVVLNLPEPS